MFWFFIVTLLGGWAGYSLIKWGMNPNRSYSRNLEQIVVEESIDTPSIPSRDIKEDYIPSPDIPDTNMPLIPIHKSIDLALTLDSFNRKYMSTAQDEDVLIEQTQSELSGKGLPLLNKEGIFNLIDYSNASKHGEIYRRDQFNDAEKFDYDVSEVWSVEGTMARYKKQASPEDILKDLEYICEPKPTEIPTEESIISAEIQAGLSIEEEPSEPLRLNLIDYVRDVIIKNPINSAETVFLGVKYRDSRSHDSWKSIAFSTVEEKQISNFLDSEPGEVYKATISYGREDSEKILINLFQKDKQNEDFFYGYFITDDSDYANSTYSNGRLRGNADIWFSGDHESLEDILNQLGKGEIIDFETGDLTRVIVDPLAKRKYGKHREREIPKEAAISEGVNELGIIKPESEVPQEIGMREYESEERKIRQPWYQKYRQAIAGTFLGLALGIIGTYSWMNTQVQRDITPPIQPTPIVQVQEQQEQPRSLDNVVAPFLPPTEQMQEAQTTQQGTLDYVAQSYEIKLGDTLWSLGEALQVDNIPEFTNKLVEAQSNYSDDSAYLERINQDGINGNYIDGIRGDNLKVGNSIVIPQELVEQYGGDFEKAGELEQIMGQRIAYAGTQHVRTSQTSSPTEEQITSPYEQRVIGLAMPGETQPFGVWEPDIVNEKEAYYEKLTGQDIHQVPYSTPLRASIASEIN